MAPSSSPSSRRLSWEPRFQAYRRPCHLATPPTPLRVWGSCCFIFLFPVILIKSFSFCFHIFCWYILPFTASCPCTHLTLIFRFRHPLSDKPYHRGTGEGREGRNMATTAVVVDGEEPAFTPLVDLLKVNSYYHSTPKYKQKICCII